jgi:hypothetical protein
VADIADDVASCHDSQQPRSLNGCPLCSSAWHEAAVLLTIGAQLENRCKSAAACAHQLGVRTSAVPRACFVFYWDSGLLKCGESGVAHTRHCCPSTVGASAAPGQHLERTCVACLHCRCAGSAGPAAAVRQQRCVATLAVPGCALSALACLHLQCHAPSQKAAGVCLCKMMSCVSGVSRPMCCGVQSLRGLPLWQRQPATPGSKQATPPCLGIVLSVGCWTADPDCAPCAGCLDALQCHCLVCVLCSCMRRLCVCRQFLTRVLLLGDLLTRHHGWKMVCLSMHYLLVLLCVTRCPSIKPNALHNKDNLVIDLNSGLDAWHTRTSAISTQNWL